MTGDSHTRICNASEIDCYENTENELFNGDVTYEGTDDNRKYKELTACQCLPQCESLKYEIELVKTNYKSYLRDYMSIASLKVFFKDNEFVPLKRFQLYGTVDFLANCGKLSVTRFLEKIIQRIELHSDSITLSGGLLGLFVGVSVLSIVEIFYYFILRYERHSRKRE